MEKGIGQKVKELREARGLSQRALADELYISLAMICGIETGIKQPSLRVALALAEYFGTTVEELTGSESKRQEG